MKEQSQTVTKEYRGVMLTYTRYYHMAPYVDENTGIRDPDILVEYATLEQMKKTLMSLREAMVESRRKDHV